MKKAIIVLLMALMPIGAMAQTPQQVIGSIFNFILDNIVKNNNGQVNTNAKVILTANGNRLILGRVFLDKSPGDVDTVRFPACNNSANRPVDRLRLRVREARAHINDVRITFANGSSVNVNVDDNFNNGENSGWYILDRKRCVRSIRVRGRALGGNNSTVSAVTFVGRM